MYLLKLIIPIASIIVLSISCSNSNNSLNSKKNNNDSNKLIGKKLTGLNNLVLYCDSSIYLDTSSLPMIINYVETNCSRCVKELKDWSIFINNNEELKKVNFIVLAIGSPNFYFDYNYNSKEYYDFNIYKDKDLKFITINRLEEIMIDKTIIIDSSGTIIYSGSPILDGSFKNSFLKTIKKLNQ